MSDTYCRTPFVKQRRGSFVLVLPTGRKLRFADSLHRGQACEAIARGRFNHLGEMVDFALAQPRGFVDFTSDSEQSRTSSSAGAAGTYDT